MKKILVTGAAGFIGSNLVQRLLDSGNIVAGIDNFDHFYDPGLKRINISNFHKNVDFTLYEGDIRDRKFIDHTLGSFNPDVVVHLAARAGVRPSIADPSLYYDVNVNGTLTLLEAMKALDMKNMIFASSSSVYGNNIKTPFAETDSVDNPISPYAATKKAGELMCYTYCHLYNFNISCLRFFTVYGKNQRPEMAIQQFGRLIKEGKTITMFGDGTSRRDYTYIDDIVDGITSAIDRLKGYEVINLGNNDTIALIDLIHLIASTLGKEAFIEQLPLQPGDVNITYADITKAARLLNFKPKHSIEQGLSKMFSNSPYK